MCREGGNVTGSGPGSPLGLHRVLAPAGVLPQAAWRLDTSPRLWPDEVRVRVERLNLDAASFRQLRGATGGGAPAMRAEVCRIVAERGKMQNPVTGSGGMLTGVVEEAGADSPLGLAPGDRIATLVSLSLTPLVITDGLAGWDGRSEQVPGQGHAILFGRSIATVLPADLPGPLALAAAVRGAGGPAAVTVVCVDVPGCEGGAVLATADSGTVIFFSMATSFTAAALGAEGAAADVTMLIGNGYVPGHARLALDLVRSEPGVRGIFEARVSEGALGGKAET